MCHRRSLFTDLRATVPRATLFRGLSLGLLLALGGANSAAQETNPDTGAIAGQRDDSPAGQIQDSEVRKARNVALDQPISSEEASRPASEPLATEPPGPKQQANGDNTSGDSDRESSRENGRESAARELIAPVQESIAPSQAPAPGQVPTPGNEAAPPPAASATSEDAPSVPPFVLLGTEVPAATSTRLAWAPSQSFEGIYSATPVLIVKGAEPGPTLCLTAAVHGDELNGTETVRRVLYNLDPQKLNGAVIGVPIVNLQGFHRSSRYLSDRRDLNRYFPGDPQGSSASRIAYSFFHEVVLQCNAVVDLHTGSFYRTNLPQLRGDLRDPRVVKLTRSFGSTVVVHSEGSEGTLRRAAVEAGIPAVTLEAGAPMVLDEDSVAHSVKGIRTLLHQLGMVSKFSLWGDPEPVYYNSTWQRAPEGGIVFSTVGLGEYVNEGDLLGTITNPITNVRTEIRSSYTGRVIGMAMNQVVQPGFATHHIGIQAPEEQIPAPEDVPLKPLAASAAPAATSGQAPVAEEDEDTGGETDTAGPQEQSPKTPGNGEKDD